MSEYKRQRQEMLRRRGLTRQLVASKARREAETRRERSARESAAWTVQHQHLLDHVPTPEPRLKMPTGFGGLRPEPSPLELARKSQRADQILHYLGIR